MDFYKYHRASGSSQWGTETRESKRRPFQFGHDQVLVGWGTRRRQKHHLTSVICDFVAAVTCGEKAPEREKPDSHWKQGASKFSRI